MLASILSPRTGTELYACTDGPPGATAAVVVHSITATGNATPLRRISGTNTGLVSPWRLAYQWNA